MALSSRTTAICWRICVPHACHGEGPIDSSGDLGAAISNLQKFLQLLQVGCCSCSFAWIVAGRFLHARDCVKHLVPNLIPVLDVLPPNSWPSCSTHFTAGKHFKALQSRTFPLLILPTHCCDSAISREVRFDEALSCLRSYRSYASLNVRSLLGVSTTHGKNFPMSTKWLAISSA